MKLSVITTAISATTALAAPTINPLDLPRQGQSVTYDGDARPGVAPGSLHLGHDAFTLPWIPASGQDAFKKGNNGPGDDATAAEVDTPARMARAAQGAPPPPPPPPSRPPTYEINPQNLKTGAELLEECRALLGDSGPHVLGSPDHTSICWEIVSKCAKEAKVKGASAKWEKTHSSADSVQVEWYMERCVMDQVPLLTVEENQVYPQEWQSR